MKHCNLQWSKYTLKKRTKKYRKREETVIYDKSSALAKEQYKVQSGGVTNKPTFNAETEIQDNIDTKKEIVNKCVHNMLMENNINMVTHVFF